MIPGMEQKQNETHQQISSFEAIPESGVNYVNFKTAHILFIVFGFC